MLLNILPSNAKLSVSFPPYIQVIFWQMRESVLCYEYLSATLLQKNTIIKYLHHYSPCFLPLYLFQIFIYFIYYFYFLLQNNSWFLFRSTELLVLKKFNIIGSSYYSSTRMVYWICRNVAKLKTKWDVKSYTGISPVRSYNFV